MNAEVEVFKFGGASVKDADAVRNVAAILEKHKEKSLVVVVSAMGKMTNALEKVVDAFFYKKTDRYTLLEDVKEQHVSIMKGLFQVDHEVFAKVDAFILEIAKIGDAYTGDQADFLYDQIVSKGELISTTIIAAYLNEVGLASTWLDARQLIRTDDLYREGWVQWDETMSQCREAIFPVLKKGQFAVTQGFISGDQHGHTTTLGREGSDYSAAILSFCLDAVCMSIWKDVPGVLTADPRIFENVSKLDRLSYREAIEMTYYGAKVIHPKTIKPLQNKNIPLRVRSFVNPDAEGTTISSGVEDIYPPIVAVEKGQALLYISTRDFSFVTERHMSHLFQQIADKRLRVNMMQNTAISFVICVNDVNERIDHFAEAISEGFQVDVQRGLELISVRHFREELLGNLKQGKIVLLEERLNETVQLVVKNIPVMRRIG